MRIEPKLYVYLRERKKEIEKEIAQTLHDVGEDIDRCWFDAKILPTLKPLKTDEIKTAASSGASTDMTDAQYILSLKDQMQQLFTEENWEEISVLTDSSDIIHGHHRLLRSMRFQDPDYPGNVLNVLRRIITKDPKNLDIIVRYVETKFPQRGENVSTTEAEGRTITFRPGVFTIPNASVDPNLVSVMMPFASDFSSVYRAIAAAADKAGLRCERADDIWHSSVIIQDIFSLIFRSNIVVCDFTNKNPNVFYEAGIAHTLGKHVIPITQHHDDIPFDLRHHRHIRYLNNREGLTELESKILARMQFLSGL